MRKLDEIKRGLGSKSKLSRLQASRLKGGATRNGAPPPKADVPPPIPPDYGQEAIELNEGFHKTSPMDVLRRADFNVGSSFSKSIENQTIKKTQPMKKINETKKGLGSDSKLSRQQAARLKGGNRRGDQNNETRNDSVPPPPPGFGQCSTINKLRITQRRILWLYKDELTVCWFVFIYLQLL